MDLSPLDQLNRTLHREMPICAAMEIQAVDWAEGRLTLEMPLAPNRNHQYSAFAGSLNALVTVTGWGTVFLLLRERGLAGNIVIRRSSIRYFRPVRQERILARSLTPERLQHDFFFEMLASKGTSKIDLEVRIGDAQGDLAAFQGSYVVQDVAPAERA